MFMIVILKFGLAWFKTSGKKHLLRIEYTNNGLLV